MTSFNAALPPFLDAETTSVLAWTLIHFLWQGLAIALLLYVALPFCRSAQSRYALAVSALLAMPLTCIITFISLSHHAAPVPDLHEALRAARSIALPLRGIRTSAVANLSPTAWLNLFVWAWLAGVALLSIRAFGGWLTLAALRRRRAFPLPPALLESCRALERRLGIWQRVRYVQSKMIETPAVVGCFRPIVLVPVAALTGLSPMQLEAVIAHELAHVKRFDALVNFVQIAIETVLFYHPAVWWTSRLIRAEREHCCDDLSVAVCGNLSEYVRALTFLESARTMPDWALAANGGALKARILRLLKPDSALRTISSGTFAAFAILFATGALVAATAVKHSEAPAAAAAIARFQAPTAPAAAASSVAASPSAPAANMPAAVPAAVPQFDEGLPASIQNETRAIVAAATRATSQIALAAQAKAAASAEPNSSYIDGLSAAGLKNLSVDNLIALKIQGVTPEYIRAVRAAGFNPKVDDLIGMKVQGITPAYIESIRKTGLNPSLDDLIGMKVQGVTPEYINSLKSAGLGDLKTEDYIGAKVMGVTPEFIEKVRSHGFKNLTLEQLIGLKVAGVF